MSNRFVTITQLAVQEIINRGIFSTIEFSSAQELMGLFLSKNYDSSNLGSLVLSRRYEGGVFIVARDENFENQKNSITIDLDEVDFSVVGESQAFIAIQKLFRFCIKHWNKYSLGKNEYIPPGSSKAIVFPFPIAIKNSFRLVVEMSPDAKRSEKRFKGENFLLYKFSQTEGEGLKEEANVANFRRAMSVLYSHDLYNHAASSLVSHSSVLPVLKLNNAEEAIFRGKFNSSNWRDGLTSKQTDFVYSSCMVPSRIEGPAGSGKTLCMVLKCINSAREAENRGHPFSALFIAPGPAMVRNVQSLFDQYCPDGFHRDKSSSVRVRISTLHEVCSEFLGAELGEADLLDDDPQESKDAQLLYLSEIIESSVKEISKHKSFLSGDLFDYFSKEDSLSAADLLRHEISTVIKGRSGEKIDHYLKDSRPAYGLPIKTDNDRKYVFGLFMKYREVLDNLGQYDVDDIVISVAGRLDTPLWRRKRKMDGYDALFVDELHLFNFNEFSIFHFLTKKDSEVPITVAADPSQALGDIAWDASEVSGALRSTGIPPVSLKAVFRCSPPITELAFSVVSHGQTLFTTFDNPMEVGSIVEDVDVLPDIPQYHLIGDGDDIFEYAYKLAKQLNDAGIRRSDVLFVVFDRLMYEEFSFYTDKNNKPALGLSKRGDIDLVIDAERKNSFVFGLADYVGGLEFKAVILVGVDSGRVPAVANVTGVAGKLFQSYVAHNRVYVAVTRAQSYVRIIGEKSRGVSEVFSAAKESGLYDEVSGN